MAVTITFDLEDNRAHPRQAPRYQRMTEQFLEFLDARAVGATVFVVGELAGATPELVRRVAEQGHELGLHGLRHVPLAQVGRACLREELRRGKALVEDAAGVAVRGFRAPIFSLTPATAWALDDIAEAGFDYDSSVLPARNPLHGWPGAPKEPFRWRTGMLELPCPVAGRGRLSIPYLGGVYLRYLPRPLVTVLAGRAPAGAWTYLHPYDLDPDEPFFVLPHASWLTSRILHMRRRTTLTRLATVLDAVGAGPPLVELAAGLAGDHRLPVFEEAP